MHSQGELWNVGEDECPIGVPVIELSIGEMGARGYRSVAYVNADIDEAGDIKLTAEDHENARLILAAWNSYHRAFGDRAVEAAEADLLGELVKTLAQLLDFIDRTGGGFAEPVERARAILARVPEGGGA